MAKECVLVVLNDIPVETKFFLIPLSKISLEDDRLLNDLDGKVINGCGSENEVSDEAVDFRYCAFLEKNKTCCFGNKDHHHKFSDYIIATNGKVAIPSDCFITRVIHTSFIL